MDSDSDSDSYISKSTPDSDLDSDFDSGALTCGSKGGEERMQSGHAQEIVFKKIFRI